LSAIARALLDVAAAVAEVEVYPIEGYASMSLVDLTHDLT
jgi:hypothetical protein